MDMRYMEFLSPGKLFYELAANGSRNAEVINYIVAELNQEKWIEETEIDWRYCINKEKKMPKQGWKIHITAELSEAQKTLDLVTPYLIENNISFKFVPNEKQLLFKNSKNGDRSSTGKFITIYPENTSSFLEILEKLEGLTEGLKKGTYILNDKRWKDSNVFFRYGAFVTMFLKKDGQRIPAIEAPDGTLIPDLRAPYYEIPDFIEEPEIIQEMTKEMDKELEKEDTSKFDEYEVTSALHFSNGGGVYKVEKHGKTYVMKEGRYGAGLDRLQMDSFKRVEVEADVLAKLNDKPYTVDFYDYFKIWENNYLIEEFVSGISLMDYVAQNFPFSHKEDKPAYTKQMIQVIDQLIYALEDLHKNEIALGDLQPSNVLILDDFTIKLIDLETVTTPKSKYSPALMTPGYVTEKAKTFEEADWYALLKIARFLFLPIENLTDLSVDIELNQDLWIEENFGTEVLNKLNRIKEKSEVTIREIKKGSKLEIPLKPVNYTNIDEIVNGLRDGVISYLEPSSTHLIHGDIRQFTERLGSLSVANGGFGGIMALDRSGELPDTVYAWVDHILESNLNLNSENFQAIPTGLFNGISGVISVLYDIGYQTEALHLLKELPTSFEEDADLTLYSGLSGVGLNYLAFYTLTQDQELLTRAKQIGKLISEAFKKDKKLYVLDTYAMPYGLLNGWSGVSLFMLQLGDLAHNNDFKNLALEMLNKELNENIEIDDNLDLAQVKEYSLGYKRLVPYLGEGAAGIALVMLEFKNHFSDFMTEENEELTRKLTNVTDLYSTFASGIFRGAGGMIVLANANREVGSNEDSVHSTVKALGNYLLYQEGHGILSPGEYGYRLSLDLQTGNSGLILALCDINRNKWNSWLPLPKNNRLIMFENSKKSLKKLESIEKNVFAKTHGISE